jgi:hypothetical protein
MPKQALDKKIPTQSISEPNLRQEKGPRSASFGNLKKLKIARIKAAPAQR